MSYTVVCPYCNDAVCIPMTMCNNIFRHGVFVEKSNNYSDTVFQHQVSICSNNCCVYMYDSNYNPVDEDFRETAREQLEESFFDIDGCNCNFKVLYDDMGNVYARKMGDDVQEHKLHVTVPQGYEAGYILNVLYDNESRQLEVMLPEQTVPGDLLEITFILDENDNVDNLKIIRHAMSSFY